MKRHHWIIVGFLLIIAGFDFTQPFFREKSHQEFTTGLQIELYSFLIVLGGIAIYLLVRALRRRQHRQP